MSERVVIFIDGSNFYHSLKDKYGRSSINFAKLAVQLAHQRTLVRTYYYNASVLQADGEDRYRAQQRFFQGLRKLPYFDLRLGRLEKRGTTVVEKGIDVRISIDMLQQAYANVYDTAVLVSGDADYVPAVEAVKGSGKHVELAALPKGRANQLVQVADLVVDLEAIIPSCWI